MRENKSFKERRKEPRFTMQAKTYAVLGRPANKIGKILDISRSGLSFTYLSTNEPLANPVCRIDLLAEDEGVTVENLSFSSVSDCEVPNNQPFRQITMRRHSFKFENLDEDQANALELFIKKYCHGYQESGRDYKRGSLKPKTR